MIMNGLKTGNVIVYGNREDTCYFCALEKAAGNREAQKRSGLTRDAAARELQGQFVNKPMFRFPVTGGPYLVCQGHMHKFVNQMDKMIPWKDPNDGLPIED